MTGLDPVSELTNSTTGKAYEESIDIATFGTKETYQLFKDIKKTFRKSQGYQVILKGVLWKLPIDMAIELVKLAIEIYDSDSAATIQTRINECIQYGNAEINKYPGELENKEPQLIGFMYQGILLYRKIAAQQEAYVLMPLNHQNIVRYIEAFVHEEIFYIFHKSMWIL